VRKKRAPRFRAGKSAVRHGVAEHELRQASRSAMIDSTESATAEADQLRRDSGKAPPGVRWRAEQGTSLQGARAVPGSMLCLDSRGAGKAQRLEKRHCLLGDGGVNATAAGALRGHRQHRSAGWSARFDAKPSSSRRLAAHPGLSRQEPLREHNDGAAPAGNGTWSQSASPPGSSQRYPARASHLGSPVASRW